MKLNVILIVVVVLLCVGIVVVQGLNPKEEVGYNQAKAISLVDGRASTLKTRQSRIEQIYDLVDRY